MTKITYRKKLLATIIALSAPYTYGQSMALEEILITGTRTGLQNSQDVPIAISAIDEQDIQAFQISGFDDLSYVVPNFSSNDQLGDTSSPTYSIRGITSGLLSLTVDSGIGLYLDGVYVGRPAGSAFEIADVERVEVLRGPQATLYGRNTTGGAISFITKKPTGEAGLKQTVTAGNYGLIKSKTTVESNELAGFSAKLSFLHSEHDGYQDNTTPGVVSLTDEFGTIKSVKEYGVEESDSIFAAIHWENDSITVDYGFDWSDFEGTQKAAQLTRVSAGIAGLLAGSELAGGTGVYSQNRLDDVPASFLGEVTHEVQGHNLTVEAALNDELTLMSITGYREWENTSAGNDPDGNDIRLDVGGGLIAGLELFSGYQERNQHQFSQELQLIGIYDKVEWVAGLYYFTEDGKDVNPNFPGAVFITGVETSPGLLNAVKVNNESLGVFGQATYRLSEEFSLGAGIRYSEDYRELERIIQNPSSPVDETFSNVDWQTTLSYLPNENVTAYAKISTGYLSGGFQNGLSNFIGEPVKFEEETLTSYELGLKTQLLENRLRANMAVFQSDYDDLQVAQFVNNQLVIQNAGQAVMTGFEVEVKYNITSELSSSASYGYTDVEYKEYEIAPGVDIENIARRTNAPESTFTLGVVYETPLDIGYFSARLDTSWRDDVVFSVIKPATAEGVKADTQEDHWLVNARLTLSEIALGNGAVDVSLWGKNLLDEDVKSFAVDFGDFSNAQFIEPLTYGVDVTFSF